MKLVIPCVAVLLVALTAVAHGQSSGERAAAIRRDLTTGNTAETIQKLREFQTADTSAFSTNNFDYLLARLQEQNKDAKSAANNFRRVIERQSVLAQYAVWHLAGMARATGDLVQEREHLRQILSSFPNSVLREAAVIRLADSFFESKDYLPAVATLKPVINSANARLARQASKRSGEAYVEAGKITEARAIFARLISTTPDLSRPDDYALAAVRSLDSLEKTNATALSEADHWQRAGIYQFNRDFDGARTHYLAIISGAPQSSSVPESLFQLGRGFYQQEKYDDALKYLQQVQGQYESNSSSRDALALMAGAYVRLKQLPKAVATYKDYINRFPNAPNPERPYLNLIDVLRDDGRDEEALSWVKQTRDRFKDQLGSTLALFSQARIHIARGAWQAALADLDELSQAKDLGGARVAGGTSTSEVAYLRGLVLEQLGRSGEALDAYLSVPTGRNEYYGFRSDERLRALTSTPALRKSRADLVDGEPARLFAAGQVEAARKSAQLQLRLASDPARQKDLLDIIKKSYERIPAYNFPSFHLLNIGREDFLTASRYAEPVTHRTIADELLYLQLYDEAAAELAASHVEVKPAANTPQKSASTPSDVSYTEALYALRGGLPYQAVRFAEQVWRAIPSDYLIELAPREFTEMLYPAAYKSSALKWAQPRQLDPRFVLSIARQETRFQAEAKSVAAARGLMQFIPATADQTAAQLGYRNFDQDQLYNPDIALQFGSQYLSSIFAQFPQQPQAVAAAYNGGPDNVGRWMRRARALDPDRYVPEIGFSQSKDYVFRVLANYWVYQKLYDNTLQPVNN